MNCLVLVSMMGWMIWRATSIPSGALQIEAKMELNEAALAASEKREAEATKIESEARATAAPIVTSLGLEMPTARTSQDLRNIMNAIVGRKNLAETALLRIRALSRATAHKDLATLEKQRAETQTSHDANRNTALRSSQSTVSALLTNAQRLESIVCASATNGPPPDSTPSPGIAETSTLGETVTNCPACYLTCPEGSRPVRAIAGCAATEVCCLWVANEDP